MSDLISSHICSRWIMSKNGGNFVKLIATIIITWCQFFFLCLQTINYSHHQPFQPSVSCSTFRSTRLPLLIKTMVSQWSFRRDDFAVSASSFFLLISYASKFKQKKILLTICSRSRTTWTFTFDQQRFCSYISALIIF